MGPDAGGGTCPTCERHFKDGDRCPFDATPLDPPTQEAADPLSGTTIDGKFLIESRLGSGGMGVVYAARQLSLDRVVALKVLAPGVNTDRKAEQRFRVEAKAASQLRNPHAVTIHDFGVTPDAVLYIAMELLEGESLRNRIRRGALDVHEAVTIGAQIAEALAEAHERRPPIIHRDVKPDNVIVRTTAEGEPFATVLDFGLALVLTEQRLTAANVIVGTVAYMAPEQAISGREIDDRVDIYALGISLFEMLTGETPFKSPHHVALLHQHVYDAPPSLREQLPDAPAALDALVSEMLAKEPSARPTARQVRARLLEVLPEFPRSEAVRTADTISAAVPQPVASPRIARSGHLTPSEARQIADVISGGLRVRHAVSLTAIAVALLAAIAGFVVWRGLPSNGPVATSDPIGIPPARVTLPRPDPIPTVTPDPVVPGPGHGAGSAQAVTATDTPQTPARVRRPTSAARPSRAPVDPSAIDADILHEIEATPSKNSGTASAGKH
jgi:serine/threonine-protein kinase